MEIMSKKATAPAKPAKKNLDAFRSVHDKNVTIPNKIRAGLTALKKAEGAEAWEYEGEFVKRAGIAQTDLGAFRSQFEDHIVETKGKSAKRVWFVDAETAATARDAIS
jgi:hypothetical protein